MWLFRRPPALHKTPTVRGGAPPDPDTQEQVVINQVRAAEQWNATYEDLAVNEIAERVHAVRASRRQVLLLGLLAIVILIAGLLYSANVRRHDRILSASQTAAERTPYVPEAIH